MPIILLLLALVLASCGTDNDHFKIEGRFLNLNQGELRVYSLDGGTAKLDTIHINGGRFSAEIQCSRPQTLMLVFPNFSEQPLFAAPGQSVDIKADASHLKEMEVKGTADNELMTAFRKQIATLSPPETQKAAAKFITDHPQSVVSTFLLRRYFIQTPQPDYRQAAILTDVLLKKQPENGTLINLKKTVEGLRNTSVGQRLPSFSTYDSRGNYVSLSSLRGRVGVICVWASWSYDSQNMQRMLKRLQREHPGKLSVVSICLDASKKDCNTAADRDSIKWPNICDGLLFDSPAVNTLGIKGVPDNIIVDPTGKIVDRGVPTKDLSDRIKKML